MCPRFVAYCIWDGTSSGIGKLWGGTWGSSLEWAKKKQNHIKFIANFSHKHIEHEDGIPHVWVNIGHQGQKHMTYNNWKHKVAKVMVETLSRGCDVLTLVDEEAVEFLVHIHPCCWSVGDVHKIISVWDQSDVLYFCIRSETDSALFASALPHQVHKKIGKKGLVDDDAKYGVRGLGSTGGDSKEEVTAEIKGRQTKDEQGSETEETKQKETKDKQKETTGPVTKGDTAAAASPNFKAHSKIEEVLFATLNFLMVGHQHEDVDQICGGKEATQARPKPFSKKKPVDGAHDSGSEYEFDGSKVLRRSVGSLIADARFSGPTGSRSARPRSERRRSECSFREPVRREPIRGTDSRNRSRSQHCRYELDRRGCFFRRPRSESPRSSGPQVRSSLLSDVIFDNDFKLVLHADRTAAGCMKHVDLKMIMTLQELVTKSIAEVKRIGTSNVGAREIAEITKYVRVSMACVTSKHLSTFMAASIMASAAGREDEYNREDSMQSWSATTVILFFLFYGTYFGIIICVWEATKLCLKTFLVKMGLGGQKKVRTRTSGINTENAIPVIPPPPAAAPRATTTTLVATTSGSIYMTRLAGECYHTRRNCGHLANRERKVIEKCLDCARFDG